MADEPTRAIPQLNHWHLFVYTTAVALVLGLQVLIAISISPDTFRQLMSNLKPHMAALVVVDAMAKALALCSIPAFVIRQTSSCQVPRHPAENLWLLLGLMVLVRIFSSLWSLAPVGLLTIIGGCIAAWLSRNVRWRIFYAFVALSPVLLGLGLMFFAATPGPGVMFMPSHLMAVRELLICCLLSGCLVGSRLTPTAWGAVLSQFSLASVSVAISLLMAFGLWQ